MSGREIVQEGDWVVLLSSDGKTVLGNVTRTSSARLGKRKRNISAVLGREWGESFIVREDALEVAEEEADAGLADISNMASEKNNQFLQDNTANQALKHETITKLKENGVRGEELVRRVVEHSATFKAKTAFSQDKYLAKKRTKFDLRVRLLRPTAATLCEAYFSKNPDKILNMRVDSLGLLLSYSGVRSGTNVLMYENCTGLVTGAVTERLGGAGHILTVFAGSTPPGTEVINMLNLDEGQTRVIVPTPVELFEKVYVDEKSDIKHLRYVAKDSDEEEDHKYTPSERRAAAIAQRPKRGAVKQWLRQGCDSLIVATRYDPVKVFDTLLQFIAPSGAFAAYCPHLQEAADLQYALQLSCMATRIELWESGMIQHQILPGRTHPAMTDSASGGYVVTGIRIETAPIMKDK